MPILNSKAQGDTILAEHIATMYNVVAGRNILPRGQQRGWFSPNFFYY
jgi:hypothetical protein